MTEPNLASFLPLEDLVASALAYQKAGQIEEARVLFNMVLQSVPEHPQALHQAGLLEMAAGNLSQAVALLERAVWAAPGQAPPLGDLGVALARLGRSDEALASFDAALVLRPDLVALRINRANLLSRLSRLDEALEEFDQAVDTAPDMFDMWRRRGKLLLQLGETDAALTDLARAAALAPQQPGVLLDHATALHDAKRWAQAVAAYQRVLALQPQQAGVLSNLGLCLLALNRPHEALEALDEAVRIDPTLVAAHANRGLVQRELRLVDEAFLSFDKALALDPDHAQARCNLSVLQLLAGRFEEGWRGHEERWRMQDGSADPRGFSAPQWMGDEEVAGKTILIHAEQGFGDTLHFCRYAKLLAQRGAKVILEVQPALKSLLVGLEGVSVLLTRGEPLPPFDLHCPLMSLPLAFHTDADSIPGEVGYLTAPADRVEAWRAKLGPAQGLRVGVAWFGKPTQHNDHNRSLSLKRFLAALPAGVEVYSLHDRVRAEEADLLAAHPQIRRFENEIADFADTAALASLMDVVVTVCTSVAHLAAGLGKPTWILLPFSACWRWLLDRDDSPWYPTVRLFRQPAFDDWETPVAQVRAGLTKLADLPDESAVTSPPARDAAEDRKPVLLAWQAGADFGWGVLGLNLLHYWANSPRIRPFMGFPTGDVNFSSRDVDEIQAVCNTIVESNDMAARIARGRAIRLDMPVVHALGNGLDAALEVTGALNIGRAVFQNTNIEAHTHKLARYDALLCASNWNADLLRARSDRPVHVIHEAVDHSRFFPAPRRGLLSPGRFHVFTGGKIELIKAQDLVLAAFRQFARRHDDAVLVTAWHSPWPEISVGFQGKLDEPLKLAADGRLDVVRWAAENSVPPEQFIDLGQVPNSLFPHLLREVDCTLQCSRAEGATNLVAKEAMACGLPVILADNSGVRDIVDDAHCIPLRRQGQVQAPDDRGTDGWGESDVEEIVDALERLYASSELRRAIGDAAAAFMQTRTWAGHAVALERLLFP